ncbi:pyrrolo-quinoline quinone, partial [Candidatus Aerophobetes bacterium]
MDWTSFRGRDGRGASPARINPPIGIKWKLKLQLENNPATVFNPPVIRGNTVYFGAPDGNFYALDINSGYMRWVFKTGG